jgi:hypothetical protein
MILNESELNEVEINGEAGPEGNDFFTGPHLIFTQTVRGHEGESRLMFTQTVIDTGDSFLWFTQNVGNRSGDSVLTFTQRVIDTGDSVLWFSQNVYDPAQVSDSWVDWDATITVDDSDISAQVIGTASIAAERSSARLADFSVRLSGVVNVSQWIGKSVLIDYNQPNGTVWRRFKGVIQKARYDIAAKTLHCTCTDDLQLVIDSYSNEQLQQLTTGYFSEHVFSADNTGWDRFNDLLKTVNLSVQFNSNKQLIASDFQNKLVADFTFDENLILNDSLSVKLVERNQLTNRVDIEFNARYKRLFENIHSFSWRYSRDFCDTFFQPIKFPARDMVKIAVEDADRHFLTAGFSPIWPSGVYYCNAKQVFFSNAYPNGMRGFTARTSKRWSQSVTDKMQVSVLAPDAIILDGAQLTEKVSSSAQFDSNHPDWGSVDDDYSVTPPGMVPDGSGNDRVDDADDEQISQALKTLIAKASTTILKSHQKNEVVFQVPLSPYIELDQTLDVIDVDVQCKGVVKSFKETYNFDSGDPITQITLAISSGGSGLDRVGISIGAPVRPALSIGDSVIESTLLIDHIGGLSSSPQQLANWTGMILNAETPSPGSHVYSDSSLKIPFDAIDDNNKLNSTHTTAEEIKIAVPDNLLTITA